ncbi:hypothetical protein [Streptomyces sp. GbtcB6]|uniref:hypothetical protein n=1 Tax=Streptomyces sp. GbtcB6 TaxID=2824751 RepID=UPI001C2F8B50|nr:hypothetical protein [Streptomyces sp. GbtcB6]
MGKPDTRRVDREISKTQKKLEAVQRGEWWPLTGKERRDMFRAMAGGARSIHQGHSTSGAETRMDSIGSSVESRLNAELTALHGERQRIITEYAQAKAKTKSSGWW